MILVPKMKKIATAVVSFVLAACSLATTAFADQPYEGYNYDWWDDPVPSQTGYVVDRVVTGLDFKTGTRYNTEAQLKEIAEEHGKQYFASQQEVDDYNAKLAVYEAYKDKLSEYTKYEKALDKYNTYLEKLAAYEQYQKDLADYEANPDGKDKPKKVSKPKEVEKPAEVKKPDPVEEVKELKANDILMTTVQLDNFSEPSDLFIDRETEELYIVDSGNNRILITDVNYEKEITILDYFYNPKTKKYETLNNPHGIFVRHVRNEESDTDTTMIYIADYDNNRVLGVYKDGTVFQEFTKPSSEFYEDKVTFQPNKVVVDVAGNVYVNIKSITTGAVMFAPDGTFSNYFGANRVEQTAQAIANKFWKTILDREAAAQFIQAVPMEFSNFDIDEEGFIYTVTEAKSATTDVFKKMNPAGENILINLGFSDYIYGDKITYWWKNENFGSRINDVDVDENGTIRLLDTANGRIFEYTDECDLLFIYGGKGSQKGLFTTVRAVEAYNDVVYVLDSRKASITTFKRTEFGDIVHEAMSLYTEGKYEEAREPWNEVLSRDSNYWFAYIGLGNAELSQGNYQEAMNYFYRNSRPGYDRAFKQFRMQFIRDNFNLFMIIIAVVIVLGVVISKLLKMRKQKKAGGK